MKTFKLPTIRKIAAASILTVGILAYATTTAANTAAETTHDYDYTQAYTKNKTTEELQQTQTRAYEGMLHGLPNNQPIVPVNQPPFQIQLYAGETWTSNPYPSDVATVTGEGWITVHKVGTVEISCDMGFHFTLTVVPENAQADQPTFIISHPGNKTYGDPDFDLATQGGVTSITTEWETNNMEVAFVINGRVSITGTGNVIITAKKTANTNYKEAKASVSFSVAKAQLTVTPDDVNKAYGDNDPPLTFQVEGLKNNETKEQVLTGSLDRNPGENVAAYDIIKGTLNVTNPNYNTVLNFITGKKLNINKATLNVTPDNQTKVYGEPDPTLTYTPTGFKYNDPITVLTGTLGREQGDSVAQYEFAKGTLDADNYDIQVTPGKQFTITPATLTVTPKDTNKVYGTPDPELPYEVAGLQFNDTVTGNLARTPGDTVGTYNITQGTLTAGDNYQLTVTTGKKLIINKATLTVTPRDTSKVYGNPDPELTYKVEGLKGNDIVTGNLARTTGDTVGTYNITQGTLTAGDNYQLTVTEGKKLIINKATLTVTAKDTSITYLDEVPTLTVAYEGFVNDEDTTVLTNKPSAITTATQGDNAGNYDITVEGAKADNYFIEYVNGTLTVNRRNPTNNDLTFNVDTVVYDGEGQEVNVEVVDTLQGFGDIIGLLYNDELDLPITPGNYSITVYIQEGDNYNQAQLQIGTLVVDKAPIDSIKFNFDYTATPDQAVEIPDVEGLGYITVKFNGSTIIPTTPGVYKVTVDHKNGAYYKDAKDFKVGTYTIKEDGTPVPPQNGEDDPVDIKPVVTTQDKVWTSGTQLFVDVHKNGFLQVYTISGQLVTVLRVNAGQKIEINLRPGIYVIVSNGSKSKVVAH